MNKILEISVSALAVKVFFQKILLYVPTFHLLIGTSSRQGLGICIQNLPNCWSWILESQNSLFVILQNQGWLSSMFHSIASPPFTHPQFSLSQTPMRSLTVPVGQAVLSECTSVCSSVFLEWSWMKRVSNQQCSKDPTDLFENQSLHIKFCPFPLAITSKRLK